MRIMHRATSLIRLVIFVAYLSACGDSALKTTLEWARLSPLPPSARDVRIETKGSAFTREFVLEFHADLNEIEAWLKDSPGTSSARVEVAGAERRFTITPGGGAQFAEVLVDQVAGKVRVRTYWS